jgi:hypothetical protein
MCTDNLNLNTRIPIFTAASVDTCGRGVIEPECVERRLGEPSYGNGDTVRVWLGVEHEAVVEVSGVGVEDRTIVEVGVDACGEGVMGLVVEHVRR